MTLLGGDAAALFGELLADEYAPATLRRNQDVYDNEGNLVRGGQPVECRVQVDRATERMVQSEGFTAGDQALYVLAQPGGELPAIDNLDTNCEITVLDGPYAGNTYKVGSPIDRDPGAAYWLCRGTAAKASNNG